MTPLFPSIRYGGDYNPEQWSPDVWDDDVSLMQRAGVTTATVGVFSWGRLEPRPGEFDFAWLDDIIDRLHRGGIRIMMATATASPPAWFARQFPESLPVTSSGTRLGFGSRQQYSPSSSAYREHALRLVTALAERYGQHPALEAWHIGNEYGCHVPRSYDPESAAAFRVWLAERYGSIDALNAAWGTAFWSQQYADFDEISPPADAPTTLNPTQLLDFDRFSSDALLSLYRAERAVLNRISPQLPVTTNFMGFFRDADYWQWAEEVDFVSDDSYPDPTDPDSYVQLAASRDLMRSLGRGRPWLLMEQATSAVNWREHNHPKPIGIHRAQSLQAVARGADGILHFQWRQAQAGSEKFHSAMVPHAGPETRVFRDVEALGRELASLTRVVGAPVASTVGILFDWDSWRTLEQEAMPSRLSYVDTILSWYRPFLDAGVAVDFVRAGDDLGAYRLVVVPAFVAASTTALDALDAYAKAGGTLLVGYQTAVLDESLHARLGGYLGPLQETLGLHIEEFAPLSGTPSGSDSTSVSGDVAGAASLWQEIVRPHEAQVVSRFDDGFAEGEPAITRNEIADGVAWYVATQLGASALAELVARVLAEAGISALISTPQQGLEAVRRGGTLFVVNHSEHTLTAEIGGLSYDVPARDVLLIEDPSADDAGA